MARARGSVYNIKTSIHWKRSNSGIQKVVEKFLELISNMLQNEFARSIKNRFILSNQNLSNLVFSDRNDLLSLRSVFTNNHGTDLDAFSHV